MTTMTKRARRSEEQRIADLEAKIAELKARAERKKAKRSPGLRHIVAALRSTDKALAESDDNATRRALDEARANLSACLALHGVANKSVPSLGGPRGRRSAADVERVGEKLLEYVRKHPGQRGEQIAAALGTDVTTMRRPMKALIEDGQVKTKGQRRGMQYFAT